MSEKSWNERRDMFASAVLAGAWSNYELLDRKHDCAAWSRKCPRGLEVLTGSIKLGWWIEKDPGATFDESELVAKVETVLDRLENALSAAMSQSVDVYIDGEGAPPTRVCFDIGGKEIEIDDGPLEGTLDDVRAELGE